MLYKRSGIPEEDEIVLCKVSKIYPNSVFVDILEYGQVGIVHISEVSPGRIRNLRDYVSIDRQIVCKVLRIDREKGHIDLSLRRVNSTQRLDKLEEIKQELKAEALLKNISAELKRPVEEIYREISPKIFKEYSHLYPCFREVAESNCDLIKLGLDKKVASAITAAVVEKFKPKKIYMIGEIVLQTYDGAGLEKIKNTLKTIENISSTISLSYLGAGRYKFVVEDFDYKPAEATLRKIAEVTEKFNDKLSTATFEREKTE